MGTLTCKYLHKFLKKFKTVLMRYSRTGVKLIHEKNEGKKSRDNATVLCYMHGLYVNSTTQRCPNKIITIFLVKDFFHLHLEPRISPRIFQKIWNGRNGIMETVMKKTRSQKSRDTVPLIFILWVVTLFSKSVLPATNRMLNISQYSISVCNFFSVVEH